MPSISLELGSASTIIAGRRSRRLNAWERAALRERMPGVKSEHQEELKRRFQRRSPRLFRVIAELLCRKPQ